MLLAAISTSWAIGVGAVGAVAGGAVALLKFRPERDNLTAQTGHVTAQTLMLAIEELRRDLGESKDEVERLKAREVELLERIEKLERAAGAEREQLLARIAELEAGCHCRQ